MASTAAAAATAAAVDDVEPMRSYDVLRRFVGMATAISPGEAAASPAATVSVAEAAPAATPHRFYFSRCKHRENIFMVWSRIWLQLKVQNDKLMS